MQNYAKAVNQARTAAGGWDRDSIDFTSATATRSSFSDEDGDASIESWISSQREAITGRLKILVEIRTCLDRHREAALAAAGAIRCIAEKLPPKLSAASSLIEGDALAVDDGALLRAADETSERCEAEWLASQSIDCLQMMLVGYLRLHDRLTSTAATASSSGGSAKTTALRLVRDRLRLESGPINALGGWQLRQLLLQVVGVQLQGNLFLRDSWQSTEDDWKEEWTN
ncbi:hypothetical protein BOX15_Mlig008124g1 [Macrostomum lignano]|uniref:Uncharacterized protein n=1 Tax=Macrostomum lignano TaxID=282301 RepID=A0A267EPN3_9PLAT|nr:hypothetical protein BOX15_Mlig008124g4 [Macrostomum lignano]PAA63468.1 hypothetical protein BOX15_Mlig008124g1 [Macrostomum lignano]